MDRRPSPTDGLLEDFSLEMTAKDVPSLDETARLVPAGTRVNITFLGNEDHAMRLEAARAVRAVGLTPVPHIAARRIGSETELDEILAGLADAGAAEHLCMIGGDPATPAGPFPDSLTVIRSGMLTRHGVRSVSIAGYPDGHPDIPTEVLWDHLERKVAALAEQGLDVTVITQFSFDHAAVRSWILQLRDRGITAPVRVGTPGPVSAKRLLGFARRFGIGTNALIIRKYGFSLTNLMGTAGPDRFVTDLASDLAGLPTAGDVGLHFYTFGGLVPTSQWAIEFTAASTSPSRSGPPTAHH